MNNEEMEKIEQFALACDEMINSKFIMADSKIPKILKIIANSQEIYTYLAECLLNFDFEKELGRCKIIGFNSYSFNMPEEDYKKVALVFCFLVEVDSKNISLYDFVTKFFRADEQGQDYEKFASEFLLPFKNEILRHFNMLEEDVEVEKAVEEPVQNEDKIEEESVAQITIKHLQSMINIVQISPKVKDVYKEKITLILKGFIDAVEINNKNIMFALEIALADCIKKAKPIYPMYEELLNMLVKIYSN